MRKILLHGAASALLVSGLAGLTTAACGARTGLPIPETTSNDCVSLSATAGLADLDVFIMMDSSRSMEFGTASGTSKWQAVGNALAAFVFDIDSSGLGVAITFFPEVDPNVPTLCDADAECGVPSACTRVKACLPSSGEACESNTDCADAGFPDDTCEKIGFCEGDEDIACAVDLQPDCADLGACLDKGYCNNHYACQSEAYQDPAVDVTPLPDAAAAVLQAIGSRVPDGSTPTLPALTGAIARVAAWTEKHPSHKAIVVLATDGAPTVCDPAFQQDMPELAVQHVAEAAAAGAADGIQTFVIGVFAPEEQAEAAVNLDLIAKGGGSESAFLISTDDNVTQSFLAALNDVRITAKSCELAIPLVDGVLPDLTHLTVQITPPGGDPVTVKRLDSAAQCDPVTGGFTYDKDPAGPTPPGRILLCPASCELFGSVGSRTVDILVSCDEKP